MRWIKLEPVIQSEGSKKKKNKFHILIYIYGRYKSGIDKPQFFKKFLDIKTL